MTLPMMNKWLYSPGSYVWAHMGLSDTLRPAVIIDYAGYIDMHSDGYQCPQYYADVTFPQETVEGALVSHCTLSPRTEEQEAMRIIAQEKKEQEDGRDRDRDRDPGTDESAGRD